MYENQTTPTQVPPLQISLDDLEKCVDELQACIKALEERLAPVLLPETSRVEERDHPVPAEPHSIAVSRICVFRSRTGALIERVLSITSRLEV